MSGVSFRGRILITEWSNLNRVDHCYATSNAEDTLLKSVAKDILISDNKTSASKFFYNLLNMITKQNISLNHKNSKIYSLNNEIRIVPNEQKLFESELVTVDFNA